ncbi:MAG: hypothetical protein Kow00120_05590 [Anaerolineae bacterium]
MSQKIIVGMLALTLIGAVGVGVHDAAQPTIARDEVATSANAVAAEPEPDPVATVEPSAPGYGQAQGAGDGTGPVNLQETQFVDNIGDPWSGSGTITSFDQAGMTLTLADGSTAYVELGPAFYWQAQDVVLAVGDWVSITGFFNGDQIHAVTVTTADGAVLQVRTDEGAPLWSGGNQGQQTANGAATGAANGAANGAAGGASNAGGLGQQQVAPEDWVTLNGVVTVVSNSSVTVETETDGAIMLSLGRPDFWQVQGVTFVPGDAVRVLGYWQGAQFRPGEIVKVATGERLMLLDPNGRPLWGGPGRAGNGQAGQQGAQAQAGQGMQPEQGQAGQGAQGQQGQGSQGRGYRGGRQG